ncbi:MAG: prolipoprotein diacylglyceryl transferase [Dermatophilaceae bacterium]
MTGYLPSPTDSVLELGPLPLRMYALCILVGIVVAVWLTGRRLVSRGYERGQALDVAAWAVLFGIVGGRLYHVVTTPDPYWGPDGNPVDAVKIWEGGLGIWGAISLGALGAYLGCRRHGISFLAFADAAAPGVALAQAIGRWGNWFNNELYGGPTTLPWGLEIHVWDQSAGRAVLDADGEPVLRGVFHPTFLYESVFLVLLAVVLLVADRRARLAPGQLFGMYVAGYPIGRIVVERMRTDEAEVILGQRLNVWTSVVVFLLGVWIIRYTARRARRQAPVVDDGVRDGAPSRSDGAPAGSDGVPSGSDGAPAGSGGVPAGSDSVPAGSDSVPSGSDSAPAGSDSAPAGSDSAPAGSDSVPSGSDSVPSGSDGAQPLAGSASGPPSPVADLRPVDDAPHRDT